MSDHPLAGGAGGGVTPAAVSSPRAVTGATAASPQSTPVVGSVSYSSDEDDSSPSRPRHNPYATTLSHLSSGITAPRPRSDQPRRLEQFWSTLHSETGLIDETIIRSYVFDYGCPEQPSGIRGLLWKLLLGYIPWSRMEWSSSLKKQRAIYQSFVNELTNNPFEDMNKETGEGEGGEASSSSSSSSSKTSLKFQKVSAFEDPLSTKPHTSSKWLDYYKDNGIREEIEKDVRRTYSNFHFFCLPVKPQESSPEEIRKSDAAERIRNQTEQAARGNYTGGAPVRVNLFDDSTLRAVTSAKDGTIPSIPKIELAAPTRRPDAWTHHDVIKRILFIYAKLNPGIRYVQGMNELLAPVYYVFAHDGNELRRFDRSTGLQILPDIFSDEGVSELFTVETAEADAFFCFTAIMSQMRDRFIKSLDLAPTGVLSAIANLNTLLRTIDYPLWQHLHEIGCDPRFYSFRWLTLVLSQEFELPDTLRLWDTLFAAEPEASREGTDHQIMTNNKKTNTTVVANGSTNTSVDDSTNKKLIVEHLNDVCVGMLVMSRDTLLSGDFSIALKTLQSAGSGLDIQRLLFKAQEIRKLRRAAAGQPELGPAPPSPLRKEDLAEFTKPVPRPGEHTQTAQRQMHIPLLNALTTPPATTNTHTSSTARVAPPPSYTSSPSPSDSPLPSPSSSSSTASTSLASSVSHAILDASTLAGGLGKLVVNSAVAAVPVVKDGLTRAKEAGQAGIQQVAATVQAATTNIKTHTNTTNNDAVQEEPIQLKEGDEQ